MLRAFRSTLAVLFISGCSGKALSTPEATPEAGVEPQQPPTEQEAGTVDAGSGPPTSPCGESGLALAGVAYDVARSRFAFGSTPTVEVTPMMTRYVGKDGSLAIRIFGAVGASMNAGASAGSLPDWSTDANALSAHVREYFIGHGVPACQIQGPQVTSGIHNA